VKYANGTTLHGTWGDAGRTERGVHFAELSESEL